MKTLEYEMKMATDPNISKEDREKHKNNAMNLYKILSSDENWRNKIPIDVKKVAKDWLK
jgi:hypothetical protein